MKLPEDHEYLFLWVSLYLLHTLLSPVVGAHLMLVMVVSTAGRLPVMIISGMN